MIKAGNNVSWSIDGSPIANFDATSLGALGGDNFALGVSDVNATTTRHPSLLFTVFDNVQVTDVTPEPASFAVLGLAAVGSMTRRRRAR